MTYLEALIVTILGLMCIVCAMLLVLLVIVTAVNVYNSLRGHWALALGIAVAIALLVYIVQQVVPPPAWLGSQ